MKKILITEKQLENLKRAREAALLKKRELIPLYIFQILIYNFLPFEKFFRLHLGLS